MQAVKKYQRFFIFVLTVLLCFSGAVYGESEKDKEKKRRKLLEKMQKLQNEKDKLKAKEKSKISKIDSKGKTTRAESIILFERIVASTKPGDVRRCDALFQLGALYYEDEREKFIIKQNRFQREYEVWEKSGGLGASPVEPLPSYARSINTYKQLVIECPTFGKRDVVLYKLGNIFTAVGDFESAFESFHALIKDYPQSENVPYAHLRVGEYYYIMRDNQKALQHYAQVGMKSGPENYLLALYRIASCYYNMSRFEDAINKFFEYVELADSGKFKKVKADFRAEAIEYMAISFSEMEDGAELALKFFKRKGGRPYQDQIIYTVGIKNRDHDNVKEAIKSLNFLLKNYPLFIEAPMALKALVDCYVVEKDYHKANALRERLILEYGPGSKWERAHSAESDRIAKVKANIREAAAIIPLYYHQMAVAQQDSGHTERAVKLMNKALEWYKGYVNKFPGEKWNVYTFRYYMADLLSDSLIGRYSEAAREFNWVSRADTSSYPSRRVSREQALEKKKKEARDIKDQFSSDIEEKVKTISVNPEEAGFAAVVCKERLVKKALKAKGLSDSTVSSAAYNLPEMKEYLEYIKDYKNRFPNSNHAAEVAFLEANVYFDMKNYPAAIEGYQFIVENFPNHEKIYKPSIENQAKAYLQNKEYEKALEVLKRIYHEFSPTAQDKKETIERIAAAMFQIAEAKQKAGDYTGSADYFKRIVIDYPDFSKCDVALFNAAFAYESGRMYTEAAREFERVFDKFPKSKRRRQALLRAAAAYEKGREFGFAARMFLKYTDELPSDSQAVPCIFRAAFMHDSAQDYMQAAQTYEKVFDVYLEAKKDESKYITAAEEAPGALYSAGLIYEKAKRYQDAIRIYSKLEKEFPRSKFTAEAVLSIAICYEKLEDDAKIAESYLNYTQKYGSNKAKVVESLMKVAKAYQRMGKKPDEDRIYRTIIEIQKKYGANPTFGIDPQFAAESYFILGQRAFEDFSRMDLRTSKRGAAGNKEIAAKLKRKTEAIKEPLGYFTECIALQTDKWTTRATFMCGEIFWNLKETVKNQPILERDANKIAYAKVKVNEALPAYYNKAMEYYFINVDKFANKMGVQNEWTDRSAEKYAQCWYEIGFSHVENGDIFSAAPNPFPKGTREYDEYQSQIKGIVDKLIQKCIPVFENGIRQCTDLYINNSWVERMKKELAHADPQNAAINIEVKEPPKVTPQEKRARFNSRVADEAYERAMKQIKGIYEDNSISYDTKVSMLKGIEIGANREIRRLTDEINELKAR